jgi:hypothetical protein
MNDQMDINSPFRPDHMKKILTAVLQSNSQEDKQDDQCIADEENLEFLGSRFPNTGLLPITNEDLVNDQLSRIENVTNCYTTDMKVNSSSSYVTDTVLKNNNLESDNNITLQTCQSNLSNLLSDELSIEVNNSIKVQSVISALKDQVKKDSNNDNNESANNDNNIQESTILNHNQCHLLDENDKTLIPPTSDNQHSVREEHKHNDEETMSNTLNLIDPRSEPRINVDSFGSHGTLLSRSDMLLIINTSKLSMLNLSPRLFTEEDREDMKKEWKQIQADDIYCMKRNDVYDWLQYHDMFEYMKKETDITYLRSLLINLKKKSKIKNK